MIAEPFSWLPVLLVVLAISLALAAWRMVRGPGYADRFVALDMLTGVVVAIGAVTGLMTGRSAFFELGLAAALVNFASTCAFAAFISRKRAGDVEGRR